MSAGTLVGEDPGQDLKSKLIPLGLCQAQQPDAKIWAQPLSSCRLPSGSMCRLIGQFPVTKKASGEDLMVHLYLFLGHNSAKEGI